MKKTLIQCFFKKKKRYKLLLAMKMAIILTLVCSFQIRASVYSQSTKLTLKLENKTLIEVFKAIRNQSDFRFAYNITDVEGAGIVSVDCKESKVEEILDQCLKDLNLTYKVIDNVIVIKPAANTTEAQQEEITIEGEIMDEQGLPLPGVNVIVKETMRGTTTGNDGKYSFKMVNLETITLQISFIGMQQQEVTYKGEYLKIVMKESIEDIDEVVVNGYFTRNKNSFTGNVIQVKAEEIEKMSNSNVLETIQLFDPSFVVHEDNLMGSDPNRMPEVTIRGKSSLPTSGDELRNNPNQPVYIMDGFEVSPETIFDLDMDRIASFQILKDASASAIYGSRAANGVVVIETKRPKAGKMTCFYNVDFQVSEPDLSVYNVLNAREKLEYEKAAGLYNYYGEDEEMEVLMEEIYRQNLYNVERGVDTYWLAKPVRTGYSHKHSLTLQGGDQQVKYSLRFYSNNQEGVMKESGRNTNSAAFKLLYRHKRLSFSNELMVNSVKGEESPFGSFSEYARTNPYYSDRDEKGNHASLMGTMIERQTMVYRYNPAHNAYYTSNYDREEALGVRNSTNADWAILEGLRLKGSFSIEKKIQEEESFDSPNSITSLIRINKAISSPGQEYPVVGTLTNRVTTFFNYEARTSLSYQKVIGKHVVNTFFSGELAEDMSYYKGFIAEGFSSDKLNAPNFANQYKNNSSPSAKKNLARRLSGLGNLSYTWDNRFLTDFSYRIDGSSVFGTKKPYANFWAAGLAWNLHNESFLKGSIVSTLRLRANTGLTGSVQFSPYQASMTYEYQTERTYGLYNPAVLKAMGNEELTWQETLNNDYGFKLGLFKDRFTLNGNYYIKTTEGQVTAISLAPSTGFSSYTANLGTVENKGYEIRMRGVVLQKNDSYVSLWGRVSHNENTIKEISESLKAYNDLIIQNILDEANQYNDIRSDLSDVASLNTIPQFVEGGSMDEIRAVRSMGIDAVTGKEVYMKLDGTRTNEWDAMNQVVVGSREPKFRGSFGIDTRYKNFSFNAAFSFRYGGQVENLTLLSRVENANPYYNVDQRVYDFRWREPGDVSFYKKAGELNATKMSSRFIEDDNTLTLSRVNLSYDFNKKLLSKIKLKRLKLSVYMNDIFRLSTVKMERGIQYPFARSVSFSLKTNF